MPRSSWIRGLRIQLINSAVPVCSNGVMGVSKHHRRRVHWYGYLGMTFAMLAHWLCLLFPTSFWTSFLQWSGWASLLARFFFVPVPCALEAQTVINTSCLIGDSPVREKRWDNDQGVTRKHEKQNNHNTNNPTTKPKGHLGNKVKHYAFRKVPMPLSPAPRWCSKYHS